MKRRVIVNIYDDMLEIGEAFKLLDAIGYDHSGGWEKECVWGLSDGHNIKVDITPKSGIRFDIWRRNNETKK